MKVGNIPHQLLQLLTCCSRALLSKCSDSEAEHVMVTRAFLCLWGRACTSREGVAFVNYIEMGTKQELGEELEKEQLFLHFSFGSLK